MFENIGLKTAAQIASVVPGLEKTVSDAVAGMQALLTETIVPIAADIVSQSLARVDALDGASVTLTASAPIKCTISVELPTFTAKVSMPLKLQPQTFTAAPEAAQS